MSKELKVKGRVQNKHNTEAEWLKSVYVDGIRGGALVANPFIPLDGELIVYDPDSIHSQRRIKIGDGVTNVDDLPFYNDSVNIVSLSIDGNKITYMTAEGETYTLYDQEAEKYFLATDEISGVSRLYKEIGENEDGSMTQKAIKTELDKKASVALNGNVLVIYQNTF